MNILLADDHKIMREGLRNLIEKQADMTVVGEAEDGRTAADLAGELMPDIVVMDVAMPEMNGIDATRQIVAGAPRVKVIALSMHADKRFIVEMLKAGASGYLLKDCAFEELTLAIRAVSAGRTYLSPRILDIVVKDYVEIFPKGELSVFTVLTAREREVLQLFTEGEATKDIASKLDLSVKTIETYRQHIMDKLKIYNVAELTKYAIREGLTSL